MTGWRDQFIRKGSIIKTVIADGTGNYTKLSDALNAITDASATKRYAILVFGVINDTALIVRKSYVDCYGYGAIVNITSNSAINGVNIENVVFSTWKDIDFHRLGTPATSTYLYAVYVFGTTDHTCRTFDCKFYNDISDNDCWGLFGQYPPSNPLAALLITAMRDHIEISMSTRATFGPICPMKGGS